VLPFRQNPSGEIEILILTSRETQRFIIPKGWPKSNKKLWKAAEVEAREEAGIVGKIKHRPLGTFRYWKRLKEHFALVEVDVYPLHVEKRLKEWPEKAQRQAKWLPLSDAALLVDEPQLVTLIRNFSRRFQRKSAALARVQKS
jgi:8-oxo-dGTP pyrophosphatase MutT (NUDIX family)